MSWGKPPDSFVILSCPEQWRGISRDAALLWIRSGRLVVIYQNCGFTATDWFNSASPFYMGDRPYDYGALRYFIFVGAGANGGQGRRPGAGRKSESSKTKAKESEEWESEPAEIDEELETEEVIAPKHVPGKILAAKPPKPTLPGQPPKPTIPDLPPKHTLPDLPPKPTLPDLPPKPALDIPEIPKPPDLPRPPELKVPEIPPLPKPEKRPIEIKVVDALGAPLAGAKYSLVLPDQSRKQGVVGSDGFIRVPDNLFPGEVELILEDLEA